MKKKKTAVKSTRISPTPAPIVTYAWLNSQFEKLHREHLLILDKLNSVPENVTPELETQVLKASKLATSIDQKVPDSSPAGQTTKKKGNK